MSRRRFDDRGSAIHLFPVGVLVVLVLGAMAVDVAVVHLATRQALDAATSAADGAATTALDRDGLRGTGTYRVDPGLADLHARRAVVERALPHRVTGVAVTVEDGVTVVVRVTLSVDPVLAGALPGAGPTTVTAVGRATAGTR